MKIENEKHLRQESQGHTKVEYELLGRLNEHLRKRNWSIASCSLCGQEYYRKKQKPNCGRYSCLEGYEFLPLSRKKEYTFLDDLAEKTRLFFRDKGYNVMNGQSVISEMGNALFTVAGVQLLDKVIHKEEPIPERAFFVAQPVIRMKFLNQVGKTEGISTSFVNICTEQVNPSVDDHIKNFDSWLEYLSSIGLFVGDMTLTIRDKISNWGKGDCKNIIVDVNYGGLHLGDACFLCGIPQENRENLMISDIGFGLERVCWALNKSQSYFDSIGPRTLSFKDEYKLIDSIRTMTLMAGCGVEPSNKAQGYRLRRLSKGIVDLAKNIPWLDTVPRYYLFWSKFTQLEKSMKESLEIVRREYNRNLNAELASRLELQMFDERETEDFISFLIQKGTNIDTIRSFFKE